ncbi:MAG: S-layer protein [Candidatus Woesearchaeota archaeon]
MRIRNMIKRIVALGTGATMLGATLMGAIAVSSLSEYPAPYITNGQFNGKLVVGDNANPADILGAIDIAASLQRAAKTAVSCGGGVSVSNGAAEEVTVGTAVSSQFGTTLDDTDLPFLADSSVTIDTEGESNTYDYHEEIALTSGLSVETGLSYDQNEDWGDKVFVVADTESMKYKFVFDETLQTNNYLTNASEEEPIEIDFLGKTLTITGAAATSITVQTGEEKFLNYGASVNVDGKTVKLEAVSDSSAVVSVNGQSKTIGTTKTATINGLRVKVVSVFNDEGTANDAATLRIGTEIGKTYKDDEEFIGEPKTGYAWKWNLENLNTDNPTIEVVWALKINNPEETENPNYLHPLYEGESYKFPWGFAEVKFDSLNQNNYQKYVVDIEDGKSLYELPTNTTPDLSDKSVIRIKAEGSSNTGLKAMGTKTDTVYLYPYSNSTIRVYYKDSGTGKAVYSHSATTTNELFFIDYKKSVVNVTGTFTATGSQSLAGNITMDFDSGSGTDRLGFEISSVSNQFTYLGLGNRDTSTENDVTYYDGTTTTDISSYEKDQKTAKGVIVYAPYKLRTSDRVEFSVPADIDEYKANIVIQGKGGSTQSTGGNAFTINPIAVGMGVLAADARLGTDNLIVVGGPCANSVAATLMGDPADCTAGFEAGKAIIKLYPTRNAILVAGYSAADTVGASYVLANYGQYTFSGTELEVITTNLNNLRVTPVQ